MYNDNKKPFLVLFISSQCFNPTFIKLLTWLLLKGEIIPGSFLLIFIKTEVHGLLVENPPKGQNNLRSHLLHGKKCQVQYLFMQNTLSSCAEVQICAPLHSQTELCLLLFRCLQIPSMPPNRSVFISDHSKIMLVTLHLWPSTDKLWKHWRCISSYCITH